MTRTNRWPMAVGSAALFLAVFAWVLFGPVGPLPGVSPDQLVVVGLCCMALYLCSHLLRATRLAMIGLSVHGTSFRTLALLHLAVAPWSMIAPFKLDELVRINELRTLNNSLARAIITVVIDRSIDGPVLILLTLYLGTHGEPVLALYTGLIGFALMGITIGFFAASHVLALVQRHIFLYHYRPRAVQMLRIVDHLHGLARLGRETILNAAPILILCTIGMWLCEILAVGILLHVVMPAGADLQSVITATLSRANSGWRAMLLGEQLGFPAALITKIFTTGLLLVWPPVIWLYCRRRQSEVEQAHFLNREWRPQPVRRRA